MDECLGEVFQTDGRRASVTNDLSSVFVLCFGFVCVCVCVCVWVGGCVSTRACAGVCVIVRVFTRGVTMEGSDMCRMRIGIVSLEYYTRFRRSDRC